MCVGCVTGVERGVVGAVWVFVAVVMWDPGC